MNEAEVGERGERMASPEETIPVINGQNEMNKCTAPSPMQ